MPRVREGTKGRKSESERKREYERAKVIRCTCVRKRERVREGSDYELVVNRDVQGHAVRRDSNFIENEKKGDRTAGSFYTYHFPILIISISSFADTVNAR